jgi:hypothetical protein
VRGSVEALVRDHIGAAYAAQDPVTPEDFLPLVGRDAAAPALTRTVAGSGLVMAVLGAVLVGAVVLLPQLLLGRGGPVDAPTGDPSDQWSGLPGLPPEGAESSHPEGGELIASMWEHIGAPGSFGNGWLYLYADGRLIWERLDPEPSGGWIEQRLTPGGVEMLRSEIIRMFRSAISDPTSAPEGAEGRAFDADRPPSEPSNGFPRHIYGGSIQVRSGDRLVYLDHVVPDLFDHVADLWSWLPQGAWAQPEPMAYVPSRYAVCLHSGGYVEPANIAEHVSKLPLSAQQLLANARKLYISELAEVDPAAFGGAQDSDEYCFDITTEETRTLVTALDEAGLEELPHRSYDGGEIFYVISEGAEDFSGVGFDGVTVGIWPMLPHGVPGLTGA